MKKAFLLPFFTILLASTSFSQMMVGDTITMNIKNKVELKIAVNDYKMLKDSAHLVTTDLIKFQQQLKFLTEAEYGLKTGDAEKVTYTPNKQIIIVKIAKKEVFQIIGEKTIHTGFRDYAILNLDKATIYIATDDLSNIADINLSKSVSLMIDSLPETTRMSVHQFFEINDDQVKIFER